MWMLTFSDLVILLLTFFVLLLSMANMDPIRFRQANNSIKNAFGWRSESSAPEFSLPVLSSPPKTIFQPIPIDNGTIQYFKRVETELKQVKVNDTVEAVKKDNDSIVLRINDSVLFDKGQVTLNPSSYPLLRKVADIVRPLPMNMRIEGHTDNMPVTSSRTNWDISVARAVAVMRFYKRNQLFQLDRMCSVGYGESRPLAPNTTPEGQRQNRRVEFVLRSNTSPGLGIRSQIPF